MEFTLFLQFLQFCIGSFIITVGTTSIIELIIGFTLIKDLVRNGYKLDTDRMKDLMKKINPNVTKLFKAMKYIPGVNILSRLGQLLTYPTQRDQIILGLQVMGGLESLTEEEKKSFEQNPTLLSALKIISGISDTKKIIEKNSCITIKCSEGQYAGSEIVIDFENQSPRRKQRGMTRFILNPSIAEYILQSFLGFLHIL